MDSQLKREFNYMHFLQLLTTKDAYGYDIIKIFAELLIQKRVHFMQYYED